MRALPLRDQSVHVLTNFFTAFGYFDDDRENLAVLEEVARVLVPGGWFMLDFLNAERIASELAEPFAGEQLDCNGGRWLVRKWIEAGRVRKSQTPLGHNAAPREESVRLFRAEDFATSLFPAAGLRVIQTFGDYHGAPASPSAPRHIVLARRD
jgi:SAM-dependent methyltransferase